MIETYFTSDTHFGHTNILEYEKESRPFSSLEEMHETIIDRWNNVVRPKDNVYHLGDFCFGKIHLPIAARLHGNKRLILGNHDTYPARDYLTYFTKLYGMTFFERCVLSHMPVHQESLGSRWILNVHGHLHSKNVMRDEDIGDLPWKNPEAVTSIFIKKIKDKNYFNVSVEQNNLTPFHIDVIRERLKELS